MLLGSPIGTDAFEPSVAVYSNKIELNCNRIKDLNIMRSHNVMRSLKPKAWAFGSEEKPMLQGIELEYSELQKPTWSLLHRFSIIIFYIV